MEIFNSQERTLTELDHARIARLLRTSSATAPVGPFDPAPRDLLDSAAVVPSRVVSPDVVTMYSQVMLLDLESGARQKLTLCYPSDADPGQGFVSVLSPVGMNLLGMRVGAVARWSAPDGKERRAEILALLFQPEASGDYTI